jgi:hypothetical protein
MQYRRGDNESEEYRIKQYVVPQ